MYLVEWLKWKRPIIPGVNEDREELALSSTAGANVKRDSEFGKDFAS